MDLCVNVHRWNYSSSLFGHLRALGFTWLRTDQQPRWDYLGGWAWDYTPWRTFCETAYAAGFRNVIMLWLSVPDAWKLGSEVSYLQAPPNLDNELVRVGCAIHIGESVSVAQSVGLNVVVQIWNEPNLPQFWVPTIDARRYARLFRTVRRLWRRFYPAQRSVPCITAGIAAYGDLNSGHPDMLIRNPIHYTRAMMNYPGMHEAAVSGVSFHPYAYSDTEPDATPKTMWWGWNGARHCIRAANDYVPRNIPIWFTEFGCPSAPAPFNETRQYTNIRDGLELFHESLADRLKAVSIYKDIDYGTDYMGILDSSGRAKASGSLITLWRGVADQ